LILSVTSPSSINTSKIITKNIFLFYIKEIKTIPERKPKKMSTETKSSITPEQYLRSKHRVLLGNNSQKYASTLGLLPVSLEEQIKNGIRGKIFELTPLDFGLIDDNAEVSTYPVYDIVDCGKVTN
jgi:hypothetical protein